MATTRLSRKAQMEAASISSNFDHAVREHASLLAWAAGREFAEEADVREGFRLVVLKYAEKVGSAVQVPDHKEVEETKQ